MIGMNFDKFDPKRQRYILSEALRNQFPEDAADIGA